MNKNLEEFILKDIDILLEDEHLTTILSIAIISYMNWVDRMDELRKKFPDLDDPEIDYPWDAEPALELLQEAAWRAEKIVKENEEVGLYDR